MSKALDKVSQGVTDGILKTLRDLPGDTTVELKVKRIARKLTRDQSDALSDVIPRRIFGGFYQSFSRLNLKLAARVDINITPECHGSGYALDYKIISWPSPPTAATPHSLGHSGFSDDLHGALEPSEGEIEDMVDRCCVCFTLNREEEHLTTLCCLRAIGSICFEEALQETGKCYLCQAHQPKSYFAKLGSTFGLCF